MSIIVVKMEFLAPTLDAEGEIVDFDQPMDLVVPISAELLNRIAAQEEGNGTAPPDGEVTYVIDGSLPMLVSTWVARAVLSQPLQETVEDTLTLHLESVEEEESVIRTLVETGGPNTLIFEDPVTGSWLQIEPPVGGERLTVWFDLKSPDGATIDRRLAAEMLSVDDTLLTYQTQMGNAELTLSPAGDSMELRTTLRPGEEAEDVLVQDPLDLTFFTNTESTHTCRFRATGPFDPTEPDIVLVTVTCEALNLANQPLELTETGNDTRIFVRSAPLPVPGGGAIPVVEDEPLALPKDCLFKVSIHDATVTEQISEARLQGGEGDEILLALSGIPGVCDKPIIAYTGELSEEARVHFSADHYLVRSSALTLIHALIVKRTMEAWFVRFSAPFVYDLNLPTEKLYVNLPDPAYVPHSRTVKADVGMEGTVTFTATQAGIVQIQPPSADTKGQHELTVTALEEGETVIEAKRNGWTVGRFRAVVVPLKVYRTNFVRIHYQDTETDRFWPRPEVSVVDALSRVNEVLIERCAVKLQVPATVHNIPCELPTPEYDRLRSERLDLGAAMDLVEGLQKGTSLQKENAINFYIFYLVDPAAGIGWKAPVHGMNHADPDVRLKNFRKHHCVIGDHYMIRPNDATGPLDDPVEARNTLAHETVHVLGHVGHFGKEVVTNPTKAELLRNLMCDGAEKAKRHDTCELRSWQVDMVCGERGLPLLE